MRNSYCLRAAAITHLFTHVLPLPLPRPAGQKQPLALDNGCFWTGRAMRHETQAAILQALRLLARHLACACLSMRSTRAQDAARCVTFACIAAIADAVMGVVASDFPSQARAAPLQMPCFTLAQVQWPSPILQHSPLLNYVQ